MDDTVVTPCAACGQLNRLPRQRVADDPTCGRCKQKVFPRRPVEATDATWRQVVEDSPLPTLVDFWAPWCGPCRAVAPVLDAVAQERAGKVKVVKLNVDENPRIAARFNATSIPLLVVLRGPIEADRIVGAVPKGMLDAHLDRVI